MPFSRRWLMKFAAAAIGWASTLAGWFPFSKFASANMLKQAGSETQAKGTQAKGKMQTKTHVAVIGAGAFGGWTALYLLRRGARVTLLDAWGPGNSRASSGGETRVIRGTYEPQSGFLTARVACQAVLDGFLAEGGEYKQAAVLPRDLDGAKWDGLPL